MIKMNLTAEEVALINERRQADKKVSLEQEFQELLPAVQKQIGESLLTAYEAFDQAIKLSEEYGIPFFSNIRYVEGNVRYTPSTKHRWDGIDANRILQNEYGITFGDVGWGTEDWYNSTEYNWNRSGCSF